MKAVVLAGGFGTRIKPLTYSLPKPMLPLVGKPILEHVVNLLKNHGISDLVFLLYFQPEVIKNYFGDGSRFGVKISYTTPPEDYGTAGAVRFASEYLKGDEPFLITSGDLLTDVNLDELMEFHAEKRSLVTIGLTSVTDPLQFGIVITDGDDRVVKFLEKPGWGEVFSDSINAGIYVMNPSALDYIPPKQAFDFSHDLFPRLLGEEKPVFGFSLRGYWRDVGDANSYLQANMDILSGRATVKGSGKRLDLVGKDIWLGEGADIAEDAELQGTVIIGEGVRIASGALIRDSIIGERTEVEENSKISNSVIWGNSSLAGDCRVEHSIICSKVKIGEGVHIESGCVISENCLIGGGAIIKEGVRIWPSKEVESQAVVSSNLIWGDRWKRSLFEESKVAGLSNLELTPEFAAKLGAAYASFLPKGSSVLVGRDAYRAPRMIKRAFVAGALSAGVNVDDLKAVPVPVLRYKLRTPGEAGGVYFRHSRENHEVTEILFYDSNGFEMTSSFEKSFERVFQREEFRRVEEWTVGKILASNGIVDLYNDEFLNKVKREDIKGRNFRIVVDFSHGPSSEYFPVLLHELGCEVISLNAYTVERGKGVDEDRAMKLISNIVKATDATAGFWIDHWGERLNFVDETGKIYRGMNSLFLLFHLVLKSENRGAIGLPLFAPSYVEEYAKESGFSVKRTKNSARAISDSARDKDVKFASFPDGRFIFSEFQNAYDGMFALAKTLEIMARLGLKLSEVSKGIPNIHFHHATVPCPWESKGSVIKKASQEALGRNATFVDGVRIAFNGSWVLMFPDQYKSIVHIYAEAKSAHKASALIDEYAKKVEVWVSGAELD
ncbi:MAG: sugar phosphate nucleotidyltransferase [Deltaproteobacteria bacterium]